MRVLDESTASTLLTPPLTAGFAAHPIKKENRNILQNVNFTLSKENIVNFCQNQ